MKKLIVILLLSLLSCGGGSYLDLLQCNALRREKNKSLDDRISGIRQRIKELENDENKRKQFPLLMGDLYSNMGNRLLEAGQWDAAIDAFNNALKNGRGGHSVYYSLGLAYGNKASMSKNMEDINKAQWNYEKALELEPGYNTAKYSLAILLFFQKDEKAKAIAMMEEVVAANRSYFKARFALGRFYYDTDKIDKSRRVYEELSADLEKAPDSEIILDYRRQCGENLQNLMNQ